MSSTIPLSPLHQSSRIHRVFGASPFRTDGDLLALDFTPGGSLVSVEEPGVLRQWDIAARQQTEWNQLEELATLWCLSGSARLVAAAGDELSVWEVDSGDLVATWAQPSWVTAVAFDRDEQRLATGHDDGVVRLWDVATQRLLRELRGHDLPVSALAFHGDGRRLASAGEDKAIRVWDVASGELCVSLIGHTDRIPALAWHPGGYRLVSAGWDTTARVWDTATGEPIILLNSHTGQVYALAFNRDGSLLACADASFAVRVWDMTRHRELHVLRGQGAEVRCLAFHPDGRQLAAGGADRVIHLWDLKNSAAQEEPPDPRLSRTCLAVSPDGSRLAGLGTATALRVWETATAMPVLELRGAGPLHSFAASPDGRWFAASLAGADNPDPRAEPDRASLGLWDAVTGERKALLEGQAAPLTALAFSPDSTLLASAGYQSGDVWMWRVPDGEPTLIVPEAAEGGAVEALAFHPNGRFLAVCGIDWLATGGSDGKIILWDLTERRPVARFNGGAVGVAFDPSGKRMAAATLVQTVRVWDTLSLQPVAELTGHLDMVTCVAYSSDGRWLASGSDDRTVRLWDAETGEPRGIVELETQIKALCFSSDGRYLFTGNGNASCYQIAVRRLEEAAQ
jgi:WD40 repeat protein